MANMSSMADLSEAEFGCGTQESLMLSGPVLAKADCTRTPRLCTRPKPGARPPVQGIFHENEP